MLSIKKFVWWRKKEGKEEEERDKAEFERKFINNVDFGVTHSGSDYDQFSKLNCRSESSLRDTHIRIRWNLKHYMQSYE